MASSINITTQPGRLEMHRTPPRLQMESTAAELRTTRRAPQVSMDFSEYRRAVGVFSPGEFSSKNATEGKTDVVQGISRVAAEGDTLMKIEEGVSFADIAQARSEPQEAELNLVPVPPPRRNTVDPGGVTMSVRPGDVRISAQLAPIRINYQPGNVTVDTEVSSRMNVQA
jgi:Family of unknown function (DUF6470)